MTDEHTTPNPQDALPPRFRVRIDGKVQYREGDGVLEDIPAGQEVEVENALASMVLSWTSDGQPITINLAPEEFLLHVDEGRIHILP